jgi:hypothetical protein
MAINTSGTILKYGIKQVETATVVGTISGSGNVTATITGAGITGSPITLNVAVLNGDSANIVAQKIRDAMNLNANITSVYKVDGADATIVMTKLIASVNDASLNIATATGTATGLTSSPTSVNTTSGTALAKLLDITNYPDMGSVPSKIDTTDLSAQKYKTNIFGLQEAPDLTFEANYDETAYQLVNSLGSIYSLQLDFGTSDGKFNWDGQLMCYANGAGVDEVRKMTVVSSVVTAITPSAT